jgi:hypothetical protein
MAGLRVGDPHDEVLGAWLAKESVRSCLSDRRPREAAVLLDNAIAACKADEVAEIRTMGHTLSRWREEILNHHLTGASNGPTEGPTSAPSRSSEPAVGFTNFRALQAARTSLCSAASRGPVPSSPRSISTSEGSIGLTARTGEVDITDNVMMRWSRRSCIKCPICRTRDFHWLVGGDQQMLLGGQCHEQ